MMLFDIERLALTPDLRTMAAADARVAISVRLWVVMNKLGRCPLEAMIEKLGSAPAGGKLHLLMEEIGVAWPEPFCVNPPCCPRLSHDEALVIDMTGIARRGDRPGFDRLLSDLLPFDARERLYRSAAALGASLEDAARSG